MWNSLPLHALNTVMKKTKIYKNHPFYHLPDLYKLRTPRNVLDNKGMCISSGTASFNITRVFSAV